MKHKVAGAATENIELINLSLMSFSSFLRENFKIETISDVILALGESLFRDDEKE